MPLPLDHAAAAWHSQRRRAILGAHPDLRTLGGHAPLTAVIIVVIGVLQLAVAAALRHAPWYVVGASAYLFGAFVAHALGVLIHECAHNLVVRSSAGNKVLAIVANLPLVMPAAIDFRYKHLLHHKHLGEGELRDFQVPVSRGAAWVGDSPLRKVIWLAFGSLLFPRGQVEGAPSRRDRWETANLVAQVVVLVPFTLAFGAGALAYLALSGLLAFGPHPLGVRGYGEHLAAHVGQPTSSYYGVLNRLSFNVGHHVEHHDFPAVPWNRLPLVRRGAPEHYRGLATVDSWVRLFVRYVLSPAVKVDAYTSAAAFAERVEASGGAGITGRISPEESLGRALLAPTSLPMDPVAYTANWVAAARARESDRADALFHDPFAAALAGDEGARWLATDDGGRVESYVALRTRFFDDELLRAARLRGIRQVVILAAGLDARAYRLPFPADTHLFELDQPEVLAHKEAILARSHAEPRCARESLGVDLRLPWDDALRRAGFSPREPSAWLVEGLLPYLHEADVRRLFTTVSALAAAGSTLALDVAGPGAFSSPLFAPHVERMRARGIELHYTCDEPVALLGGFGWSAEDHTLDELSARNGRALPDRDTGLLLHSHCVAASRQAA